MYGGGREMNTEEQIQTESQGPPPESQASSSTAELEAAETPEALLKYGPAAPGVRAHSKPHAIRPHN